ncbi:hypothetical protein LZ554_007388 [Drepanopeziza brunnea f. sp. 'monogermtubi']|nr:hypothetical protein LZ554_007388 [Drepanopeziza brunnea f. sp. 'monogermtubi']
MTILLKATKVFQAPVPTENNKEASGIVATLLECLHNFSFGVVQEQEKYLGDAAYLNSLNATPGLPERSDVVVVGGGIHSLIYAIHARSLELQKCNEVGSLTSITVLEKSSSPGYKIGESTLTVFGVWLNQIGIAAPMLWHLFGPKDGLAFYYFNREGDPEDYTAFIANGPPGDHVPTLQMERKISELLLTLYAQRLGVTVLHGKQVLVDEETVKGPAEGEETTLKVLDGESNVQESINARLLVDASGRFHRFVSKAKHRIERLEGFNTHAYWAYWECDVDEKEIPLRQYQSVNTNHICIPEGWAWVIRLPTWEGSPIPNLVNMIHYLLDLNAAKTPADEYPSTAELVERFDLKFRWVTSIGFALRSDIVYPEDMSEYGSCEAEKKFNWVVSRYAKVTEFMSKFTLLKDLYGPGTTWYARKNLCFKAPRVSGPNWMSIGDATGFTNPLYSPGINATMGTSVFVAERTEQFLAGKGARKDILNEYELFCKDRIPNLQRMNNFNYMCFRSPATGPIGPTWQYLIGTGNSRFQNSARYSLKDCSELLLDWDWGANEAEYIEATKKICKLLEGPSDEPLSQETIDEVMKVSAQRLKDAFATGKYKGRWSGLLRYYDDDLVFNKDKIDRDVLARRCEDCGEWRMLRSDLRRCVFCGYEHSVEDSVKVVYRS